MAGLMSNGLTNGLASEGSEGKEKKEIVRGSTSVSSSQSDLAEQAIQLLEEGKLNAALQILNLCLGDEDGEVCDMETEVEDLIKNKNGSKVQPVTLGSVECRRLDESSLIEKRCLVNMRLKRYNKVVHDGKKMLEFSSENSVAYKCLLAALCKMKKLEQANEVIRLWQKSSPRDLEMMECRTKLESLMVAVKNGIEASDAFSDVEDLLGLNYDWLLLRKSKDPQWKYRPLPTSSRCSFVLCLQYRFGHCSLGEKCPDAHGEGELEEWKKRFEIENVTRRLSSLKVDDGSVYIKDLLVKVQGANTKSKILCEEDTDIMQVSCTSPLHTSVQQRKFKKFTWKFSAKSTKPLSYVSLLHEHHRQYFHISSCSLVGPSDSVVLTQSGKSEYTSQVISPNITEAARAIIGEKVTSYKYKVKVVFTPEVYGNFRQSVVFDTGDETKVVRHVSVDVVPPPETDGEKKSGDKSSSPVEIGTAYRNNIPWNFGNAEMIDGNSGEKVQSEKLGFALMGSNVPATKPESFMENTKDPLSKEHYKERMRFLLTQEERSRQEILAKYNVTTNIHLTEKYVISGGANEGMTRYAIDGALYGRINLFRDISEDTAVGRLILRSCNAVLLTKTEESRKKGSTSKLRVYFCPISDKSKNSVYLELGKSCVSQLMLNEGDILQFDIQFQLDRTSFIEQKKVIDQLEDGHLNMLFPDLEIKCSIPWSPIKQWSELESCNYRLNPKQKEALIAITAEDCPTPPILVIGPFGSGKTFTLAQCIRKILAQKNARVMVCTHSNSAADLYIKEYLDPWVKEGFEAARPLRIYYEMRNLNSVHPVVLQYCKIEAMKFRPPSYDEVMNHRVIVVTLSTSYLLMQMNLPEDTFSHILLDEAAQAMESEAITPLMSAGDKTKLVLAGDHFQLSPELFSEEARNIHPSLLERLHALYPDTHPCKLMLCENYRSHSAIIQFVSESFYTKKLECAKSQPVHANLFPLTFFAARGEDVQDSESTSYYNMAEVFELTEKITELISSWPEKWGDYRDENAIGVLTPYADQVSRIRSRLRKKGLHTVSVERVFNVQGKQFRAVFLSTVRTFRPWVRILPEAVGNEVDLGFFSSPKLLNTALTRAQSLVAVVGDPVSLCSVGKCRRIWEDYIRISHDNKSFIGLTFLQLKQSILGVEMRLTWGLNPLANEFQPQNIVSKPLTTFPSSTISTTASVASSSFNNKVQGQQQRTHFTSVNPTSTYYRPKSVPEVMYQGGPAVMHPPTFYPGPHPMFVGPPPMGYPVGMGVYPVPVPIPSYGMPPNPQWNSMHGPPPPPVNQNLQWHNNGPILPPGARNISQIQHRPSGVHNQVHGPAKPQTMPPPSAMSASNVSMIQSTPFMASPHTHNQPGANVTNEGFTASYTNYNAGSLPPVASTQSQYATGQPLYRRPICSNNVNAGNYENSFNHGSHHPQGHDQHRNQNPPQSKLTPEEINFITRALEQQASTGESCYGDVQNLRTKLLQVASSGDATHANPSINATSYPDMNTGEQLQHGFSASSSLQSRTQAHVGNLFAPAPPQKSPTVAPDRVAPYINTGYHHENASLTSLYNNRVWSNSNSSFPPLANEGGMNSVGSSTTSQQVFASDPSRRLYGSTSVGGLPTTAQASFNQPTNPTSTGHFKSLAVTGNATPLQPAMQMPQTLPLSASAFNNNSLPSYYDQGFQGDVGGGLKAQLSGGLRQGFGERSAFSRVNGTQDADLITDSGLGRSYANVVKAAVTTAAVGAQVSSVTMSMASNNANMIRPLGVASLTSSAPGPAPPYDYSHLNIYGAIGGPGSATQGPFNPY